MDLHAQPDENLLLLATIPADQWRVDSSADKGFFVGAIQFPNASSTDEMYHVRIAERTYEAVVQQIERLRVAAGEILEARRPVIVDARTVQALESVLMDSARSRGSASPAFVKVEALYRKLRDSALADERRIAAVRAVVEV